MKDFALEIVQSESNKTTKLNLLREYLQVYILRIVHNRDYFKEIAFVGGTALRLLYKLPRFSEDLDFSLISKRFSFEKFLKEIKEALSDSGYEVEMSFRDDASVNSAFIKFKNLLYEAEISPHLNQNLSIKIEIDTNSPHGYTPDVKTLLFYFPIELRTFSVESLFAGKCNALLTREFTKGRDFFDLAWYLAKWPNLFPNIELLNNSLQQFGWKKDIISLKNWKQFLSETVQDVDWKLVEKDVENFLERSSDLRVFSRESILRMLS